MVGKIANSPNYCGRVRGFGKSLHCIVSRNQLYSGVDTPLLTGGIQGGGFLI